MKMISQEVSKHIVGARDRSGRGGGYFKGSSSWSSSSCNALGAFNDSMGVTSFFSGFIPGGQVISIASGGAGMVGFALDKQFCEV